MTVHFAQVARPSRRELGRVLFEAGAMSSDWAAAFAVVDRADFLPDLMWPYDTERRVSVPVDRAVARAAWYAAADRDLPIVTQWDDGRHSGSEPGKVPTSSSSMPSVVYTLLRPLDAEHGMRVLDVGTGTGETAGLLTHRCGRGRVTTMDVDHSVSLRARGRLYARGLYPEVVAGDGFMGHVATAPYDRVLATVGLRRVPGPWIEQTRRGGLVVAPWGTHFSNADAVARLVVGDGAASGRFTRPVEFMKLRSQRLTPPRHDVYLAAGPMDDADTSATAITEAEFLPGRYTALPFALGLRVRGCLQTVAAKRDGARPVWFYGLGDRSWAAVMFVDGEEEARVWQSGPRRLWDEVEAAYHWWVDQSRPDHTRFGLTVTPEGETAWLDEPRNAWRLHC
ncbi:protein-L-isoaspartate(D-aspartate) O-methyltransferase [Streptomyces sp. 549]|uniref:methyltransferase domain-containing protein n=1 Tax=Streptomyces sp. 549 TaxID=3049076 RepID=UPI0024C23747|nr:methyltransferase domain-containing protein [Streptomyces sp. 549]MDK1474391.1 protein-L-isoaspartate(D-aspartate) O-methyltransferase [Streptomyces sp. 549]